jgi:ComF family protein
MISRAFNLGMDHVIAPPFCAHCKDFISSRLIFCIDCYEKIDPIVSVQIPITKTHSMTVISISDYQEPLKSLILAKSWGDIVASNQLGQLIWQMTYFKHMPCDYLMPIPLHWMRYAKRGYNQAEEIANVLSKYKNIPVANILKRVKNTPFQSSLAHDKRMGNVKEAFALKNGDHSKYHNNHLVLVDDLMTTGSTLAYSAKVLLPLKPASITAVVVCRVI